MKSKKIVAGIMAALSIAMHSAVSASALYGDELLTVKDELFVYILEAENAAALGKIEENPVVSFTYEQLDEFLRSYDGLIIGDNYLYQLYRAFTSWQVTDSGFANFYPITINDQICFTNNVDTYTFTDIGDSFVMTSSDGMQIGTYDKLYQFAYLNEEHSVTTTITEKNPPAYIIESYDGASATEAHASATQAVREQTNTAAITEQTDTAVTTTEVLRANEEEDQDFSVGTYAVIGGGILLIGGAVIAVAAKKKK